MPYDVSKLSSLPVPAQAVRRHASLSILATIIIFGLSSLGCGLIPWSDSDQIVMLTRLPTLTRTPLPTLTLTPLLTSSSSMTETEANDLPSTQTPTLSVTPISTSTLDEGDELAQTVSTPSATPNEVEPPVATATATSTDLPTLTATPEPSPTNTPSATPAATSTPETVGWSFANVQMIYTDEYPEGLLLYGDVVNDTGQTQKLTNIAGTFYDAQGQLIADQNSISTYWPVEIVPPGARIPFEMIIDGIHEAANFELWTDSEVSDTPPRQDFDFIDVNQWQEEYVYCLEGGLLNPGNELTQYLVIVAVFYNSQGKVINFSEDYLPDPGGIVGDEAYDFGVCIDLIGQDFSHYELQAWGL
jgi:hypothetical protein